MGGVSIHLDQACCQEISSTAKEEGKTLFAFAKEWLPVAAKISNEGWSSTNFRAMCDSFSLMKKMDVITLPSDFVDELIARQYKADKEGLLKMFRDMGSEIASVVRIDAPDIDDVSALAKEFLGFLPLKMFNLSTDRAKGTIEIKIVGAGRKIESTECTMEFLSSFLNSYGFVVKSQDIGLGTLSILASKHELEMPMRV